MTLWRRAEARPDLIIAVLVGGASFAGYVKTLAPTLLMADAAEFQFASYLLGIAHPTGYPLYLILGWLWSHLVPLGDVAFRINLLSAVFAALAVGLLYPLILDVLERTVRSVDRHLLRATAVIATLSLALTRTFWSQSVRAEVYALNSLFVVATLFLLLRWSSTKSTRTLYVAVLVYGLSLTHHRTMILLLPAYGLFVWLTDRSALTKLASLGTLMVLIIAPQLLYLYIPLRAPATPYLHIDLAPGRTLELYDNTLRGFQEFVMGQMFRGELGYQASIAERINMAGGFLLKQFGLGGILLGLLGVVRLGIGRWKVLILFGLSYLAGVAFNLFYFIGDIHVLFTPSYIILAIWIAVGVGWLLEAAGRLGKQWPRVCLATSYGVVALLALTPLSLVRNNYHLVDKSQDYQAREWAEEILSQPVAEGAILASNDRNEITPLIYLQYVEGARPDVVTMFPLMLPGEEYSNVVRVIDSVIDLERPIYLVKPMPGLEIKYRMEPFGSLVGVTGPAITGEPEYATDLALNESVVLVGHDLDPDTVMAGGELRVTLYWQVKGGLTEDYHSYVHLVDEEGNVVAQSDHQPGDVYYPTSLWQRGESLWDRHILHMSSATAPVTYRLTTGMYRYPSLKPVGRSLSLLVPKVESPEMGCTAGSAR